MHYHRQHTVQVAPLKVLDLNKPSQQVIECLCEATMHLPHLHTASFTLYRVFAIWFYMTKLNHDYEEAMVILDKVLALHSPAESSNPYLGEMLDLAAELARGRFNIYGYPVYSSRLRWDANNERKQESKREC